jgi:hypothetical protein
MFTLFGYISGVLTAICFIPYIRDTLAGTTKPERTTWLILLVLDYIAFFSQLAKGAGDSLWLVGTETAILTVIFLLSLRYGVGLFTKRDMIALALAGISLLIWYFTQEAAYAIFIVIFIDGLGVSLTVIKAYQDPSSETFSSWLISGIAAIFATAAVGKLDPILLSYPFYVFVSNFVVVGAMLFGRRKFPRPLPNRLE